MQVCLWFPIFMIVSSDLEWLCLKLRGYFIHSTLLDYHFELFLSAIEYFLIFGHRLT